MDSVSTSAVNSENDASDATVDKRNDHIDLTGADTPTHSQDLYGSFNQDSDATAVSVTTPQAPAHADRPVNISVITPLEQSSPELVLNTSELFSKDISNAKCESTESSLTSSQPLETQNIISSVIPTNIPALTQLNFAESSTSGTAKSQSQEDHESLAFHQEYQLQPSPDHPGESLFVQLKGSPRKQQRINDDILGSDTDDSQQTIAQLLQSEQKVLGNTPSYMSGQEADTQVYTSQSDKGNETRKSQSQNSDFSMQPPKKRSRLLVESQKSNASSDPHESDLSPPAAKQPSKQLVLSDGRTITFVKIRKRTCTAIVSEYIDESGAITHQELSELPSPCSTQSSGYMADKSSGTSSLSQNSQENILKTHRSAEDYHLINSKSQQALREQQSFPPGGRRPSLSVLPILPSQRHLGSVIVSQQRRSILAAVNGLQGKIEERVSPTKDITQTTKMDLSTISTISSANQTQEIKHTPVAKSSVQVATTSNIEAEAFQQSDLMAPQADSSRNDKILTPEFSETSAQVTEVSKGKQKRRTSKLGNDLLGIRSARNLPALRNGELAITARVIAKWPSDNFYYIGTILSKPTALNKWDVLFDDGNRALVSRNNILAIESIPCKHSVLAKTSTEDFLPALVLGSEENGSKYLVRSMLDEAEAYVPSTSICLDAGQFQSLKLRMLSELSASDSADMSGSQHLQVLQAHGIIDSSSKSRPLHSTPNSLQTSKSASVASKRKKIFVEVKKSPVKQKVPDQRTIPATSTRKLTFSLDQVFQGMVFYVTSLRKSRTISAVMDHKKISSDDESHHSSIPEETAAANKEEICRMIEELGGVVFDKYDQDAVAAASRCFLISAVCQRTVKYLQCLAANIPPISYEWINQCYTLRRFLPEKDFLLPAGVAIEGGEVIEWNDRSHLTPFKDLSVFLAAKPSSSFVEDWKSILAIAGACVVKKISANSGLTPDYMIVSNEGCTKAHINQAKRHNIPCVSPEWAIQVLIHGTLLPPDFHPAFNGNTSTYL